MCGVRVRKGLFTFALVCCMICPKLSVFAENVPNPDISLYAQSAVLMDGDTGRILYEKNGYEVRPMASTTKIMTCILALELADMDAVYTVSSYAASMPKVKLGAVTGCSYRLEDLLYSLMLESHNDTAVVIAEGVAGSVPAFAELMNKKAREIGALSTHFVTPNGLDDADEMGGHETTAADLALILRYCFQESPKKEMFLQITRAASHSFCDVTKKYSHVVNNKNAFLGMMDGALTGKTGFTGAAGYCYVGALRQENRTLIVALLGCGWPNNKGYKWTDTRHLMEYGLQHYEIRDVFETDGWQRFLAVEQGIATQVCVEWKARLKALSAKEETVTVTWQLPGTVTAPVFAGQILGKACVSLEGHLLAEVPIVAKETILRQTFTDRLGEILAQFFLLKASV